MATISNATIKIVETLPARTCVANVTCTLAFTPFDINNMKNGLKYRLSCSLMGDDGIIDGTRFTYPSQTFTGPGVPASQTITFSAPMPSGTLDEDAAANDSDEIFAKLSLVNLEPPTTVVSQTQSSNLKHHFEASV